MGKSQIGLRYMLGHEKIPDTAEEAVHKAVAKATEKDLELWWTAVSMDKRVVKDLRDQALWQIREFPPDVPMGQAPSNREGNSIQDLRLDLKGYWFAEWIKTNEREPAQKAGEWLRINLRTP